MLPDGRQHEYCVKCSPSYQTKALPYQYHQCFIPITPAFHSNIVLGAWFDFPIQSQIAHLNVSIKLAMPQILSVGLFVSNSSRNAYFEFRSRSSDNWKWGSCEMRRWLLVQEKETWIRVIVRCVCPASAWLLLVQDFSNLVFPPAFGKEVDNPLHLPPSQACTQRRPKVKSIQRRTLLVFLLI